jgi:tRNA modification GTPase
MEALVAELIRRSRPLLPAEGDVAINARHRVGLGQAFQHLGAAHQASDLLVASESLRLARAELDRLTGRAGVEDMLDALFGSFCIGK